MLKRLLLLAVLTASPAFARSVRFSWAMPDLDDYPACSTTVVSSCIQGFQIYDITTGRVLLTATPVVVPAGATGKTVITFTVPDYNKVGSSSAVATAIYLDETGGAGESPDSNAITFSVGIGAPTTLRATPIR